MKSNAKDDEAEDKMCYVCVHCGYYHIVINFKLIFPTVVAVPISSDSAINIVC